MVQQEHHINLLFISKEWTLLSFPLPLFLYISLTSTKLALSFNTPPPLSLSLLSLSLSISMKANGMLCRSHESTAVCIPCDARTMITTTRRAADRKIIENSRHLVDFKYSRLPDSRRFGPGHDRRRSAVTLPMLTKKEISREQPKPNNANVVLPPLEPVSTADHVFQVSYLP